MGGAFFSSSSGQPSPTSARNDVNVQLLWTLNNMGFGNAALIRERRAEQEQTLIELFRVQDNVAAEIARIHAELEAAAARIPEAEYGVKQAQISFAGNLKGLSQTTRFGDLLTLVNRPQEVVAALQQLATAYDNYFAAVNDFNRAQFRLYPRAGLSGRHHRLPPTLGEIHAGRHQPARSRCRRFPTDSKPAARRSSPAAACP